MQVIMVLLRLRRVPVGDLMACWTWPMLRSASKHRKPRCADCKHRSAEWAAFPEYRGLLALYLATLDNPAMTSQPQLPDTLRVLGALSVQGSGVLRSCDKSWRRGQSSP